MRDNWKLSSLKMNGKCKISMFSLLSPLKHFFFEEKQDSHLNVRLLIEESTSTGAGCGSVFGNCPPKLPMSVWVLTQMSPQHILSILFLNGNFTALFSSMQFNCNLGKGKALNYENTEKDTYIFQTFTNSVRNSQPSYTSKT